MKKYIVLAFMLAVACSSVHAKSSSQPKESEQEAATGIVTPNIATDMFRTSRFIQSATGILICRAEYNSREPEKCTRNGQNAWLSMKNSVPAGKTYVGFKSVSGTGGWQYIEVYWK